MKQTLENFQELSTNQLFLEYIATETPYTYVRTLQKGTASILYLLENYQTKEQVVLKRMRKRTLKRPKYRARYACECDALQRLDVPEVPTFLAQGQVARVPFQLMQYMPGNTLTRATPYSFNEAFDIVKRVSIILQNIHRQGFIHHHVTPDHILIDGHNLSLVGFDHVASLSPHEAVPYKIKTIADDIDQLARLFLALTSDATKFKWKKAEGYIMQRPDTPLYRLLKQALQQQLDVSVVSFVDMLQLHISQ